MIRKVKLSDAGAIAAIYNYYINATVITFEEELVNEKIIAERIEKVTAKFPWFVFEEENQILGYAYGNTWRERVAYRFTVETSVYVKPDLHRSGVGTQLYQELLDVLKKDGFKQAIGGITLPNPQSENFHEKFDFIKVGHFKDVGFKFNKWHDVGFWQLNL